MSHYDTIVHLVAGGLGGTIGAIATCPLEVVKTRLQSSVATFTYPVYIPSSSSSAPNGTTPTLGTVTSQRFHMCTCICTAQNAEGRFAAMAAESSIPRQQSFGIWRCLRHIVETEGTRALFKGLGPNLVGVAPSRAIYFCTYSHTKNFCNLHLPPDTPMVHICSAASAGFMSCTLTNPVWFVKTRLQLDQRKYGSTTAWQCIRDIYATKGLRGFYKGITASYFGISETVIHFVIYEFLKSKLHQWRAASCYEMDDEKTTRDFLEYMLAGAISKTCASSMTYPHEVARTRLRQEGDKYRSFFQTLLLVFREEGIQGLYRGLGTQLVRQIPNTAIMMATYEAVVYLLTPTTHLRHAEAVPLCADDDDDDDDGC